MDTNKKKRNEGGIEVWREWGEIIHMDLQDLQDLQDKKLKRRGLLLMGLDWRRRWGEFCMMVIILF